MHIAVVCFQTQLARALRVELGAEVDGQSHGVAQALEQMTTPRVANAALHLRVDHDAKGWKRRKARAPK